MPARQDDLDPDELALKKARKKEADRAYRERLRADPERYARYREGIRKWQLEHPEAYQAAKRRWDERNPSYYVNWREGRPNYYVEYRAKNREELAAYGREWRAKRKAKQPYKPCLDCGASTQNPKYCSHRCAGRHGRKKATG